MVISVADDKAKKSEVGARGSQLMSRLGSTQNSNNIKAVAGMAGDDRLEDERGFLELQACIPHLADVKTASRLEILLEAINYIDILHTTLIHKIHRGQALSGEDRRRVLAQYLATMMQESNKEN